MFYNRKELAMYDGKKILAIIPARKGSKRIKGKNGIMLRPQKTTSI